MKKAFLLYFSICVSFLYAQTKDFTIEDVVINSYTSLAPANLSQINFINDTNKIYFIENNALIIYDIEKDLKTNVISLADLNILLEKEKLANLKKFPQINFINENLVVFQINNTLIKFEISSKSLKSFYDLPSEAENIQFSDDYSIASFTLDNNLYYYANGKSIKISNESNQNILYGHSVHRNEFGIEKGIFLSPDYKSVAFYRMDQTMVTDYPILDLNSMPAKANYVKYPMAGGISHEVTLGIYNSDFNKIVYLETGEPKDQYLTCVTWSPDNKYIFVAVLNRDQNHMDLCKFDVMTGKKIKTLFSEDDKKFVEPEHPLYFVPNSNNQFVWSSKRDGWNHLFLYDTEGNLLKQLTKGEWEVTEIVGFDKDVKNLLYLSTEKSPLERQIFKLNINNLSKECLSNESGMHEAIYAGGDYFIDRFNNIDIPGIILVKYMTGKIKKELLNSDNPLKDYSVSPQKLITLKEEGKFDLYARIILPTNFDSTKKYPVIVYVYGGPHSQEITNRWIFGRYDLWFQYMAQKGFIVFSIDNRGTSFRGDDFAKATFRELGTKEIEDHMRGITYLKSLSYVDSNRFGVYGWSYGGFMTTSLMLKTNNTFKVGACGGAVIDWKYYEIMYTERYMDTPQSNPEGYEKSNLLNFVNNLNGKLLLVHGTSDETVVWQNTLLFANKATILNKPLDYFPYIHHPHGVRGKDALHLYNKISNYFIENL